MSAKEEELTDMFTRKSEEEKENRQDRQMKEMKCLNHLKNSTRKLQFTKTSDQWSDSFLFS